MIQINWLHSHILPRRSDSCIQVKQPHYLNNNRLKNQHMLYCRTRPRNSHQAKHYLAPQMLLYSLQNSHSLCTRTLCLLSCVLVALLWGHSLRPPSILHVQSPRYSTSQYGSRFVNVFLFYSMLGVNPNEMVLLFH